MSSFSQCAYTDSDGTDLNAHNTAGCSPHSNATWTRQGGWTSNPIVFITNRVRSNTVNARTFYYSSGTPADADYSVYGSIYVASLNAGGSRGGVAARMATGADTSYYFHGDHNQNWVIQKRVAGAGTLIQIVGSTITVGQTYAMEFRVVGTTLQMWIGGVQIGTDSTDSSVSAAGNAGIHLNALAPSDITDFHLDSFNTDDTPGGGGGGASTPSLIFPRRSMQHMLVR